MARVGGRNLAVSWLVGILCAAVVGALVWLAIPIVPALASLVGDGLRSFVP